jgi:glycosyltransferase involved in cell wall biosynthesis
MTDARITFAIPYFRGLDYLRQAIESVRRQSVADWFVLVSDDGDDQGEARDLVASFDDPRIEYHRNERNLGMVLNWNQCIDQAGTDLVTLLHADDWVHRDYAAVALDLAERNPQAAAVFCDVEIVGEHGHQRFTTADTVKRLYIPKGRGDFVLAGADSLRAIMGGNFILCPTLCFRKSVLNGRRFSEDWKQVQDLELTARLLMDGDAIVGSRTTAYAYRRHPDNATAAHSESLLRFDEEFRLFAAVAERADELGWHAAARVSRRARIVRMHLVYRIVLDCARLRPGAAWKKLQCLVRRGTGGS